MTGSYLLKMTREQVRLLSHGNPRCLGIAKEFEPYEQPVGEPNTVHVIELYPRATLINFFGEDSKIHGILLILNRRPAAFAVSEKYRLSGVPQQLADLAVPNGAEYPSIDQLHPKSALVLHETRVRQAVRNGEKVSQEILDEYPELLTCISKHPVKHTNLDEAREDPSIRDAYRHIINMKDPEMKGRES